MTGPAVAGLGARASVLIEMGELVRRVPRAGSTSGEVAGWYERKARLLEHIAADGGAESDRAAEQARRAHRHAAELVEAGPGRAGRP